MLSIFDILSELPNEVKLLEKSNNWNEESQQRICRFVHTLIYSFSLTNSLISNCLSLSQYNESHISTLLLLLSKGLTTISLWMNSSITNRKQINESIEDDSENINSYNNFIESWLSFDSLTSIVLSIDESSNRNIVCNMGQWEGSIIESMTNRVTPILINLVLGHNGNSENNSENNDDIQHLSIQCLSALLEFFTGALSLAKTDFITISFSDQQNSHDSNLRIHQYQQTVWSIFGCIDTIVNMLLSSSSSCITSIFNDEIINTQLTTSNLGNLLFSEVSSLSILMPNNQSLKLYYALRNLASSLQHQIQNQHQRNENSEISILYFNLTECIGAFLENHLVMILSYSCSYFYCFIFYYNIHIYLFIYLFIITSHSIHCSLKTI